MGFIFLTVALFAGAAKGFCGEKSGKYIESQSAAMLISLVRMILCVVIGFFFVVCVDGFSAFKVNATVLLISFLSGVSTGIFIVTWLLAVKVGAYMLVDVFLMLGVIIPTILCKIIFKENISVVQWIAMFMLIGSAFIMCSYNTSVKGKMTVGSFCLLLICGTANGLCDFMQKWFVYRQTDTPASAFNFYIYVFSVIILIAACFLYVLYGKSKYKKSGASNLTETVHVKSLLKNTIMYISVMAFCLFLYSFMKTKAALYLPSVQLYPLSQGGALILSLVMSAVFFKEKINVRCIIGIAIAFVALLLMNNILNVFC